MASSHYFRKWQSEGVWDKILAFLVSKEQERQSKNATATACAVDSQSIKQGSFISIETGIDGHKLINGRKRHIAVDSLGF
jgi:hypothetical protein